MTVALFMMIVLCASILQTSTGFGFSIMATPFLLLIFEPIEAIQINLIASLMISLALISTIKKDVDTGILKRFIIGSVPGLGVGILIFLWADARQLKLAIGLLMLLFTILLIANRRITRSTRKDVVVGGLSGAFTTGIGMPGPPLLIYFAGSATSKEVLRATTLTFYLYIYAVSLVIQVVFAGTTKTTWLASVGALPLIAAGLWIGQRMFDKISPKGFQAFIYIILLVTAVTLFISA